MKDYKKRRNLILRITFGKIGAQAKIILKSGSQKLNVIAKTISKGFRLNCSCRCPYTFPHSYA